MWSFFVKPFVYNPATETLVSYDDAEVCISPKFGFILRLLINAP